MKKTILMTIVGIVSLRILSNVWYMMLVCDE